MTEAQATQLIATMKEIAATLTALQQNQLKATVMLEDIRDHLGKLNRQ